MELASLDLFARDLAVLAANLQPLHAVSGEVPMRASRLCHLRSSPCAEVKCPGPACSGGR